MPTRIKKKDNTSSIIKPPTTLKETEKKDRNNKVIKHPISIAESPQGVLLSNNQSLYKNKIQLIIG